MRVVSHLPFWASLPERPLTLQVKSLGYGASNPSPLPLSVYQGPRETEHCHNSYQHFLTPALLRQQVLMHQSQKYFLKHTATITHPQPHLLTQSQKTLTPPRL